MCLAWTMMMQIAQAQLTTEYRKGMTPAQLANEELLDRMEARAQKPDNDCSMAFLGGFILGELL